MSEKMLPDFSRALVLDSNITLSATWVPVGPRINTKGIDNAALWLRGAMNDSDVVRFRAISFTSENAIDAYRAQVQTIGTKIVSLEPEMYETSEAAIELVTPLGYSSLVPYIQIEMAVGAAGATPAQIDEAFITFDRR